MWSGDRFYPLLAFCWCVRWKSEERYCRVKLTIIPKISNTTELLRLKTLYVYHCPINESKYVTITWRSKHNPTPNDSARSDGVLWAGVARMSAPACCATASAVARSVVSLPWGIVHWSRGRLGAASVPSNMAALPLRQPVRRVVLSYHRQHKH